MRILLAGLLAPAIGILGQKLPLTPAIYAFLALFITRNKVRLRIILTKRHQASR
jgi:hypothetical protein